MNRALAGPVALLLTASLVACGGASGGSTSKTASTTPTAAAAANSRQAAIDCLRKHGVQFGQGGAPSRQSFQAARQACAQYFRNGAFRRATPAQRARRRAAYAAVRTCMSKNGYAIPALTQNRGRAGNPPGGPPSPGNGAGPGGPRGGFGGGAALRKALTSPAGRKAVLACRTQIAALRGPGGGLGGPPGLAGGG